jgi:hypothetical protein
MKKILINFVYCNPVGHVIEAIKFAKGIYDANENIEIHLLLNKKTPFEIAEKCDWIHKVYPVDTVLIQEENLNSNFFKEINNEYDYYLYDNRSLIDNCEQDLINFHKLSLDFFKSKEFTGFLWKSSEYPSSLKYLADSKVILKLSKESLKFVKKYEYRDEKFCIMLGGSAEKCKYPSVETWEEIINAIIKKYPNCKIYLTGIKKSKDGRTDTSAYSEKDLDYLFNKFTNLVDAYDIGLWNQIALISICDIFISPHTGFAFLSPCVNTPWLAISGREWHEYLYNQIPFYSVLPECKQYSCYNGMKKECDKIMENPDKEEKLLCMSTLLLDEIPEILKGIELLLNKSFTYEDAINLHKEKLNNYNKEKFFSFDNVLKTKRDEVLDF